MFSPPSRPSAAPPPHDNGLLTQLLVNSLEKRVGLEVIAVGHDDDKGWILVRECVSQLFFRRPADGAPAFQWRVAKALDQKRRCGRGVTADRQNRDARRPLDFALRRHDAEARAADDPCAARPLGDCGDHLGPSAQVSRCREQENEGGGVDLRLRHGFFYRFARSGGGIGIGGEAAPRARHGASSRVRAPGGPFVMSFGFAHRLHVIGGEAFGHFP